MNMHNPPHPGELLREDYLIPLELGVSETAKALGVTRQSLSALVNGRAGVSPEMAIRLSKAFNTTPQLWLNLQQQFDLWEVQQKVGHIQVRDLTERTA